LSEGWNRRIPNQKHVSAGRRNQRTIRTFDCAQGKQCALQQLLWRERGDDFFKARIAAQRIPPRQQLQIAIAKRVGVPNCGGKLFAGEIFVANLRNDHRQLPDHF
jgi:hypothetical protein